jgi:DNA-binding LacI/PurR family transcriptional regulator
MPVGTEGQVAENRNTGPHKPTLEDVAKAAGVSRALVSIVIRDAPGASDGTRARVLAIAEELGYRPDVRAQLLARTSTRLLGVVYRVDALHHMDLLPPIYDEAEAQGYELILSGTTVRHDERRAIDTLLGYRCDALLLLGPTLPEPDIVRLAVTLPVTVLGRRLVHASRGLDTVRSDDAAGVAVAVAHLAGLGHRLITHVDGGPGTIAADRRRGYRAAMMRLGLGENIAIIGGNGRAEGGRRAGESLADQASRATAVVAFNDETAWGVMRALTDRGRAVPGDVSIVGYDASPLALVAPRVLTSIHQDAESIGRVAVRRAAERLTHAVVGPTETVFEPTLVPGETSSAPPEG